MKKLTIILITIISITQLSKAQNTFPSSGNVGIGTTSPVALLSVGSSSQFQVNSNGATSITTPAGSTQANLFSVQNSTNGGYTTVSASGGSSIVPSWINGSQIIEFVPYSTGNGVISSYTGSLKFQTNYRSDRMVIDVYGNVGIGTSAPNTNLDISGKTLIRGSGIYAYNNPGIGELQIGYGLAAPNTAGTVTRLAIQPYGHTGGPWKFDARDSTGKAFLDIYYGGTGSGSGITVNDLGNVSIGTSDGKGYKLAVNGSAIATSMTVKLNGSWPDYVFKKDYQLPALSEVKTYIDQNYHLPDMPSQQEVAKDGINVGEMNKLLTKKMEELTLYLIQQKEETDKRLRAQQQEIEELKQLLKK